MSTYDDILEEYRRRKNGEANGTPDTSSPTEQTAGGSSYDDIAAEYQRIRGGGQTSATTVPEEQPVQPVTQRPTPSPLRPGRAALIQDETAQQQVQTPQKSFASDPFGYLLGQSKQVQQQAEQAKQPSDPTEEAGRGKTLPGGQRMETIDPGRLTQKSGAEDYSKQTLGKIAGHGAYAAQDLEPKMPAATGPARGAGLRQLEEYNRQWDRREEARRAATEPKDLTAIYNQANEDYEALSRDIEALEAEIPRLEEELRVNGQYYGPEWAQDLERKRQQLEAERAQLEEARHAREAAFLALPEEQREQMNRNFIQRAWAAVQSGTERAVATFGRVGWQAIDGLFGRGGVVDTVLGGIPWGVVDGVVEIWRDITGSDDTSMVDPLGDLAARASNTAGQYEARAAARLQYESDPVKSASDILYNAEIMLPYLLLVKASGGTSIVGGAEYAGAGTTAGLEYLSAAESAGSSWAAARMAFGETVRLMAHDAGAQWTWLTQFAESAATAREEGADGLEILTYALTNASVNTLVEMGGGLQRNLGEGLRALRPDKLARTMLEESGEEELQHFFENGLKQAYKNVELYSEENPEALINLDVMAQIFIDTALTTPFIVLEGAAVDRFDYRRRARVAARNQATANEIKENLQSATEQDGDEALIAALEEIGNNRRLSRVFEQMYKTSPQEAIESIRQTEAAQTPTETPSVSPVADSSLTEGATGEETPQNPVRPQEAAGAPLAQGGTETAAQAAETPTAQAPALNSNEGATAETQTAAETETAEQPLELNQGESAEQNHKKAQFQLIQQNHPNTSSTEYTWIDSVDDIKTFDEAFAGQQGNVTPDFTAEMIDEARRTGKITVYSSHRFLTRPGTFVTPSKMLAQDYAGGGKVYAKTVDVNDIAWIDEEQGQYAKVAPVQQQPGQDSAQERAGQAAAPTTQAATETETPSVSLAADSSLTEGANGENGRYAELGEQYGTIEAGENPARESAVPRKIDERRKTGETARAIYEAGATPERRLSDIEKAVVDGKFSYVSIDNETLADKASEKIQRDGWDAALRDWTADVRAGKANENLVAMGATLLNNAGNSDLDWKGYVDLASDYNRLMHSLGRGLAAARILKTLSPEGRLYGIQRSVESMNEELEQKYKDKAKKNSVEIDPKLIEEYRKAETDAERDEIIGRMQQNIADQIPSTLYDKWVSLRYLNMLGNFKTQIRNVLGNITMMATASLKNHLVRGGLENIAYGVNQAAAKATGGKVKGAFEREVAMGFDRHLYADAWADFKNVESEALGEKRYSDSSRQFDREIQDKRRIWKNNGTWGTEEGSNALLRSLPMKGVRKGTDLLMGGLNAYSKLTEAAMEYGDQIFSRMTYADAMASWMKAHKVKHLADMSPEMLERARMFAIQEAQEATFRDSNGVSSWFSKAGRGAKTPFGKFMEVVGEGIMPFRKTPANVLVRGFEYSPLGILSTGVNTIKAIKGTATGHDVINSLSKTFTGTGLAILGYLLAAAGLLRTKDDDDKLEKFNKDSGQLDYSINIGGKSITLDWLAPDCIPLFMGAAFQNVTADGGFQADDALKILGQLTEPMLEMSMLSGVQDAIEGAKDYSGTMDGVPMLVLNSLLSWATQGVSNSLVRQSEQASEQYRRQNYTNPDNQLPTGVQRKLSQYFSGIPGYDYQQVDYIDAWGRRQDQGSQGARIAQSLLNPANISPDRSTPYDEELRRLYKKGNTGVLPQAPAFNTNVNGTRLTPEEWERYATVGGEKRLELIGDFLDSEEYKRLDDDTRAQIIGNLYEYSNWLAGREIARQRGEKWNDSWDKVESVEKAGVDPAAYLLGRKQADTDGSGGTPSNQEVYNWLLGSDYSERQQRAIWDATKGTNVHSWDEYRDTNPVTYLMNAGMTQKGAQRMYAQINTDGHSDLTQRELYQYYLAHPEAEELIREYWDNQRGFSDSWAKAKRKPKKDWTD